MKMAQVRAQTADFSDHLIPDGSVQELEGAEHEARRGHLKAHHLPTLVMDVAHETTFKLDHFLAQLRLHLAHFQPQGGLDFKHLAAKTVFQGYAIGSGHGQCVGNHGSHFNPLKTKLKIFEIKR
jgi:hypothetical protein